MSFANPFAPSLRRAHLHRTGQAGKVEQADHGENYSGWAPRIPRVNHLDPVERSAHIHNVESRRRQQKLISHTTQLKLDIRGDNEKSLGPGVSDDMLDQWSRTRNLKHVGTVKGYSQTKEMIEKDLQFIEKSKQQMARIKKEKRLPLPHVVARNPTWMAMHTETMQRSFSALGQLEGTGDLTNRSRTGDLNSTQTGTEPRATKTINPDDTAEFDPDGDEPSPFQRSVTFTATTDAIDNFWEQRESDLFN